MLKMLVLTPVLLNFRKSLLLLTQTPKQVHPMWKKMTMFVGHLQKANRCQEILLKFYQLRGEMEQGKGIIPRSKGLSSFVVRGTLIPFNQPLR